MTEDEIYAEALKIADRRCRVAEGEPFSTPGEVGKLFKLRLSGRDEETFACAFLDSRHFLIAYEELFYGSLDGAEVHPRVVAKRALAHNAAAVIVAHNHPSGNPEPSAADRAVTARLKQSLALLDIRLLDHFVIGSGLPLSMAARGYV